MLAEYDAFLPMTARQVFYALVGNYQYPKDERAYARLQEAINRARRAGLIPMDSIRDDRAVVLAPDPGFASPEEFRRTVLDRAAAYTRPLDEGQPRAVEVWVEAVGAMPMIATVAHEFGVTVYGSGGFESVAAKHDAAQRIAARPVVTTVLSLGDLDPSGWSIVDAAADDVAVFAEQLGAEPPTVSRLAVTEQQVRRYQLPTAPQKATDRRGLTWKPPCRPRRSPQHSSPPSSAPGWKPSSTWTSSHGSAAVPRPNASSSRISCDAFSGSRSSRRPRLRSVSS